MLCPRNLSKTKKIMHVLKGIVLIAFAIILRIVPYNNDTPSRYLIS
jgi:hypothetical protein